MSILKVCACALVAVVLAITLKKDTPAVSMMICTAFGVVLVINVLPYLKSLTDILNIIDKGSTADYFGIVLKSTGIAWAAQLTSQLCSDMGYGYVGNKVELAGKIIVLSYSLPVLHQLLGIIQALL